MKETTWFVLGMILAAIGVAMWIIAASADRVFNGADAAGVAVLVIGVVYMMKGRAPGHDG